MAGIKIEIVAPERLLLSTEASSVTVPGAEGYFTVLGEHAPIMTTLKPGFITANIDGKADIFYVRSGFAEINASGLTILAEEARPLGELDRNHVEEALAAARKQRDEAEGEHKSDAEMIVMSLENFINEMTTFEPGTGAH